MIESLTKVEPDKGHAIAMDTIAKASTVTILSYEEAIQSYLFDRGIPLQLDGSIKLPSQPSQGEE